MWLNVEMSVAASGRHGLSFCSFSVRVSSQHACVFHSIDLTSCAGRPRPDHYFPDLHHLKFEIEEGTMLDGRPVRFGYNPQEFPNFSWRGYAQMSPIQVGP